MGSLGEKMRRIFCFFFAVCSLSAENNLASEADLRHYVHHHLPSIQGWCSPEKAKKFIDLTLRIKPDLCVEIGTYAGSSLFPVACTLKYLQHGVVVAIDAWDKLEAIKYFDPITGSLHIDYWGRINMDQVYYSFLNLLRAHELTEYCIPMRTTSERAAPVVNGSIDFLYIDGNHSRIVSMKDVASYLPKVRPGGYICVNDPLDTELQDAVDTLLETCEFVELFDGDRALLLRKK